MRARSVRAARRMHECRDCGTVRVREIVRTRRKCVTALPSHETTARASGHPSPPRRASHRHVKCDPAERHFGAPYTCRLNDPCKLLRMSMLPITQYNGCHMEWVFLQSRSVNSQCETRHRGGGGSTCYYDGDGDALAPSDFFAPTGPLLSCPTPVAWPSLRMAACVHTVPLGAIDKFCGDLVERATRLAGPCWA